MGLSHEAGVDDSLVSTESKPSSSLSQDPGFDVCHDEDLSEQYSRMACQADLLITFMGRIFIIRDSYNEMPESPWPMLLGRISHGSSEQLEEAFLHQLVSSPPESVDADLQNTVWNHTFTEEGRSHHKSGDESRQARRLPRPGIR